MCRLLTEIGQFGSAFFGDYVRESWSNEIKKTEETKKIINEVTRLQRFN